MVDKNQYEKIVKLYRKPLFKYCYYRLSQNLTLTEETLDDILYVLYQKWDTLDLNGNIRAYLYRVADRCIMHNLNTYNRYYTHNESFEEAVENNKLDYMKQYDDYFNNDEMNELRYLEKIQDNMPNEYKQIFVYRYIEKKTLVETSELTGIPYSSLRLRIDKIEKIIRVEVKKIFD